MWITGQTRHKFQQLVFACVKFNDSCGKPKYREELKNIADVLGTIHELISAEEPEREVDVRLANLSGAIQTQLGLIISKKSGGDHNAEFGQELIAIQRHATDFIAGIKHDLAPKPKTALMESLDDPEVEPLLAGLVKSTRFIATSDQLGDRIDSLYVTPKHLRTQTSMSFFKSACHHFPKTMATGAVALISGLNVGAAILLDKLAGDEINKAIHADQTGFTDQMLYGSVCLLASLSLGGYALAKTYNSRAQVEELDPEEQRLVLRTS